ncbi:MAG TPA: hypothetical protein VFU16_10975 [Solirubrobacterales bacterium]|nr:hypothetical protein [Solirubrobacterales bacterium]
MGRVSITLATVVTLALQAVPTASAGELPPPGGLRLQASNGFELRALAHDGEGQGVPDSLLLIFSDESSAVFYAVRKGVEVTEGSISADLGGLGSVDLRFVPTGKPRDEAPSCEPERSYVVDSGAYEGRVEFFGEEGFTEVHATRAPGEARFLLSLLCGISSDYGIGGKAPGAQLRIQRRWPGGRVSFEASTNSPSAPVTFEASIEERRDDMAISRSIRLSAGPGAFDFDVPAQRARLQPSPPFSGVGRFARPGKGPGRLHGRLSVDFPGRSNVSLTGARGSLVRYVRNPSHPYRGESSSLSTYVPTWVKKSTRPMLRLRESPLASMVRSRAGSWKRLA